MTKNDKKGYESSPSLHTIIGTLEKYIVPTKSERSKGREGSGGERHQLPTKRLLPPRKEALEYARKEELITREEFEAAVPAADSDSNGNGADEKDKFGDIIV